MTEQNRDPRSDREDGARAKKWRPPEMLPTPMPEEGYVYRYIRTSILGEVDPTNASVKFREGWVPVKAEDHPELKLSASSTPRFKGCIEVGGLILCKTPVEMVDSRTEYYENLTRSQMDSVDNSYFKEEAGNGKMPLFKEGSSKVSKFGTGT